MQLSQFSSGFNTKLADERRAGFLVDVQGFELPPAPVIGKRKLSLDVLTQRVLARQLPELRDHVAVLAEAELGINASRDELEPQFLEAIARDRRVGVTCPSAATSA